MKYIPFTTMWPCSAKKFCFLKDLSQWVMAVKLKNTLIEIELQSSRVIERHSKDWLSINFFWTVSCFQLLQLHFSQKTSPLTSLCYLRLACFFQYTSNKPTYQEAFFFLIKFPRWAKTASFSLASHSWWRVLFLIPLETKNSTQKEEFRFASYNLAKYVVWITSA